jgi:catechol 2,3-dioxygenase-like lactoylglutathione lyase family enzyme
MKTPDLSQATLRVARPTDQLDAVTAFYRDGLGFDVLFEFQQHAGFDGVMLGRKGTPFHLEFTRFAGHPAGRAPSQDHLLVFYLPDEADYHAAIERLERAGHAAVKSFNPYWDQSGTTFEDPDGYRVVLQNNHWPPDRAAP